MLEPELPPDEAERLAALQSLKILDTPPELRFDRITRIARDMFQVPIALISLVDSNRQWFKSRQGLDAPETPRNISFCGHAILGSEIFEIEDTLEDARFADNPLVTGPPNIRYYAGAPLAVAGGARIGTLCIIDEKPRTYSPVEKRVLRDLADLIQEELQRARLDEAVRVIRTHESRLHGILSNVADGIVLLDAHGLVSTFNPGAEAMFDTKAARVVGGHFHQLLAASEQAAFDEGLAAALQKLAHTEMLTLTAVRNGADEFPVELKLRAFDDENARALVCVLRDISRQREIDRLKNNFVSSVSHELRTPLTSIRGALGLVASGKMGDIPPKVLELIDIAASNSERLVRLVNDILDMGKIEANAIEFNLREQPLLPLLKTAVDANTAYAAQFNVSIEMADVSPSTTAVIDADRFLQVMDNLLSNAAKFSPRGDKVTVTVEPRANAIRVVVADHGPGIPADFTPHVFEKFRQADMSNTRSSGGTGLGLSICKTIIEKFGGEIGFDSSPHSGTRFYFDLPTIS